MKTPSTSNEPSAFERERWQAELVLREREIALKEADQKTRTREVDAKIDEQKRSRWTSPLVVAVLATAIAALGNAYIALRNGEAQRELEIIKADSNRILQMLDTSKGNSHVGRRLQFLIDAGLISQDEQRDKLEYALRFLPNDQALGNGECSLPSRARTGLSTKWLNAGCNGYYFPRNDGFAGVPEQRELKPGTIVERNGSLAGHFLHPDKTPFAAKSLPYDESRLPYHRFEIIKSFPVIAGPTEPWFDQPGGGMQYRAKSSMQELIDQGYLKVIK